MKEIEHKGAESLGMASLHLLWSMTELIQGYDDASDAHMAAYRAWLRLYRHEAESDLAEDNGS